MFTPENELGVIVVFAQEAHHHGFHIRSIAATFPDATIEKDGIMYHAEFEYTASAFDLHGHDHRKCDLIICWQNDCEDHVLPVLALSEQDWMHTDLTLPSDSQRAAQYWRRRALKAERALQLVKGQNEKNDANLPHQCEICGQSFKSQAALNGHGNRHRTNNGRNPEEVERERQRLA